jgi:hypothetical protein
MSSPKPFSVERKASPHGKGEKTINPVLDAAIMATGVEKCKAIVRTR